MIEDRVLITDFSWSPEGDFILKDGDIGDTFKNTGKGFLQEVEDRIKSSLSDWKIYGTRGAGISAYEGEINDESTWVSIQGSIEYALTNDSFLDRGEFSIEIAPLSNTSIGIRVDFNTALTYTSADSTITVKVAYDLSGDKPFIIR